MEKYVLVPVKLKLPAIVKFPDVLTTYEGIVAVTAAQYGEPVAPFEVNTCVPLPTPPLADNGIPAAIVTWVALAIKLVPTEKAVALMLVLLS